jgi:hypothetical protein
LSYFSSGSVGSGLGCTVWPEAMARTDSETRQVKKLAFNTLRHFKLQLNKSIVQHRSTSTERPASFSTQTDFTMTSPRQSFRFPQSACRFRVDARYSLIPCFSSQTRNVARARGFSPPNCFGRRQAPAQRSRARCSYENGPDAPSSLIPRGARPPRLEKRDRGFQISLRQVMDPAWFRSRRHRGNRSGRKQRTVCRTLSIRIPAERENECKYP